MKRIQDYWKEIQNEIGITWNNGGEEVDDNRRILRENENVKRWSEYSEKSINVINQEKATVTLKGRNL